MFLFILGLLIGGFFGFCVCAICSVPGAGKHIDRPRGKELGENRNTHE